MDPRRPLLYATVTREHDNQVRHLIVLFIVGSPETQLIQMVDGVESQLLMGTEFEARERANKLLAEWAADGFSQPKGGFVFETLPRTKALAARMGYVSLYDPGAVSMRFPDPNPTGQVPLSSWPGVAAKAGGSYLYALDQMRLHARPMLPAKGDSQAPMSGPDFAAYLSEQIKALAAVGSYHEFVLNDRN